MIKLIIFDWDDVFTKDSIKGYYACYHEALRAVDVELDPAEEERLIKEKWGAGHKAQLKYILEHEGKPELLEKANQAYEDHFYANTFTDHVSMTPGAVDFLKDISKRYKVAIATGGHPDILKKRLFPKFGISEDWFVKIMTIYDLDDMAHAKPHPYMPEKIMEVAKVKPEETVLVGDAASDMQMAWNAGIEPVAVLTGHLTREEAEKLGVKHIIRDVTKLEDTLEQINEVA